MKKKSKKYSKKHPNNKSKKHSIYSQKLERCILKVKYKEISKGCHKQNWKGRTKKGKCYNPWAVCKSSVKKL